MAGLQKGVTMSRIVDAIVERAIAKQLAPYVNGLEKKIGDNENSITLIQETIANLGERIEGLSEHINNLLESHADTKTRVTINKHQINMITNTFDDISKVIASLASKIKTYK